MVSCDPLVIDSPHPLDHMLLLDHTYLVNMQIPAEIPMYSGFGRWLISPNHTSPQEVEIIAPGPTERTVWNSKRGEEALRLVDTSEDDIMAIQSQHLTLLHLEEATSELLTHSGPMRNLHIR